jgi:hypothetical protein
MKKHLFVACLVLAFVMIWLYNILTPYINDDFTHQFQARNADSLWSFILLQYSDYLSSNARVVGQFFVRLALIGNKHIFNVVNSFVFIILVYLIYINTCPPPNGRSQHSPFLFLLTFVFTWRYIPAFGSTILWISGAGNYLWTAVIYLCFITFYRQKLEKPYVATNKKNVSLSCLLLFVWGVVAGWCNENTSGGTLLLMLMLTAIKLSTDKAAGTTKDLVKPYMIAAHIGILTGFLFMILAPGLHFRAVSDASQVNHDGIIGYALRLGLILLTVKKLFFELFCIFAIAVVLINIYRKDKTILVLTQCLPFLAAGLATSFAMIAYQRPGLERAYFGAAIFIIIACLRSMMILFFQNEDNQNPDNDDCSEKTRGTVRYIVFILLWLWLLFDYQKGLGNLARIQQEDKQRMEIINEAKAAGKDIAVVPQRDFSYITRYSWVHINDATDDPDAGINKAYATWHGIKVIAVP